MTPAPAFRFVLILASLVALLATPARAQREVSVFVVPEVPIFAEAETAAQAQRIAQDMGRRRAMDILLRRLTAEEDWAYLPSFAEEQPAQASDVVPQLDFGSVDMQLKLPITITAEDLPAYEEGFAIFGEKTSGTTYRAQVTYRFKPEAIRDLLETSNLPYSESQARRALILPVLETREGQYLWETKNPWARAWLSRPLSNELTPFVLPRGDFQDLETAPLEMVLEMDEEALASLASRYNVDQVLLARANLRQEAQQYRLTVQLVDAYLRGRSSALAQNDEAAEALYDDLAGFDLSDQTASEALSARGQTLTEAFFRGPAADFPALAVRAVETTVAKHARDWKARTLIDHSAIRTLVLTAWYDGLGEWAEIRQALEGSPLIEDMKMDAFNNENAVMELTVIGAQAQFDLAMEQLGLVVWEAPEGRWNIANAARAEQVRQDMAVAIEQPEAARQPGNPLSRLLRLDRQRQSQSAPPLGSQDPMGEDEGPVALEDDLQPASDGTDAGADDPFQDGIY